MDDQHSLARAADGAESVQSLLVDLGMFQQAANKPALDRRMMDRFAERQLEFGWTHMGHSEISIDRLIASVQTRPSLRPPRTGHIGNWANIVHGRAGPRDYNHMTCGARHIGYPLLFDLNQTESDTPGLGDWSYLPGSLVDRGDRQCLSLFTWDGQAFKARDRTVPLFTPLTLAEVDGELVPLTALHRQRCKQFDHFGFRHQSDLILGHQTLVRRILSTLLVYADQQDHPEAVLRRIFDRRVTLDGRVGRTALEPSGSGYRMGGVSYVGGEELIDHALLSVQIAAKPEDLLVSIKDLPVQLPLMSATVFVLLLAVLSSHYPASERPPPASTRPCNPHLHWGGIPMAGYPPQDRGYFGENVRHLRKLFQPVIDQIDEVDPVFLVLLPAGLFNLCPHDAFPEDVECMDRLFDVVAARSGRLFGRPAEMSRCIEQTVLEWQSTYGTRLSSYLISRFAPRAGTVTSLPEPLEGRLLLPQGLASLTLQQASMTMGALCRIPWRRS